MRRNPLGASEATVAVYVSHLSSLKANGASVCATATPPIPTVSQPALENVATDLLFGSPGSRVGGDHVAGLTSSADFGAMSDGPAETIVLVYETLSVS